MDTYPVSQIGPVVYYTDTSVTKGSIEQSVNGQLTSLNPTPRKKNGPSVTGSTHPQIVQLEPHEFQKLIVASEMIAVPGMDRNVYMKQGNKRCISNPSDINTQLLETTLKIAQLEETRKSKVSRVKLLHKELYIPPMNYHRDNYFSEFEESDKSSVSDTIPTTAYVKEAEDKQTEYIRLSKEINDLNTEIEQLTFHHKALEESNELLNKNIYVPTCYPYYVENINDGQVKRRWYENLYCKIVCLLRGAEVNTPYYFRDGCFRNAAYMRLATEYTSSRKPSINQPHGVSYEDHVKMTGFEVAKILKILRTEYSDLGSIESITRRFSQLQLGIVDHKGVVLSIIQQLHFMRLLPCTEMDFQ